MRIELSGRRPSQAAATGFAVSESLNNVYARSRLIYDTRFDEAHPQSADTHERRSSKSASFGSTATAPAAFAPSSAATSHEVVRTIIGMHRVVSSDRNRAVKSRRVRSRALSSVTIN